MTALQQALQEKIKGQIVFGKDIEEKFLTDFVGSHVGYANAYIKVLDEDDIQNALKLAYLHKASVVIRGAGTNLVGSTIPEGGIVLDVSGLNRILDLDDENLTVTVEPGVKLCDLIAYVEERGYMYAPDPAEKEASIGGNVATNAGG
ncbi:MAG: FAD-binding oxidoreductase, partial [Succinatimonas sp.]|nr:FAD-binding oxidoreductase [Succinatimonas sp.]